MLLGRCSYPKCLEHSPNLVGQIVHRCTCTILYRCSLAPVQYSTGAPATLSQELGKVQQRALLRTGKLLSVLALGFL